jgi:hypothetical protein
MSRAPCAEDCGDNFYLFTSIPPWLSGDEVAYQKACIASWHLAGFKVASVNGFSEQQDVAALDLGVEILSATEVGKPRIVDVFAAIRAKDCRYAGIINADCAIMRYPDLSQRLRAALGRTLLCAERIDVDASSALQPEACSGFDGFFFDTSIIPVDFSPTFRIGEPWWDYCFPLTVAFQCARVANLEIPLLRHTLHEQSWSRDNWEHIGQHFWSLLREWHALNQPAFGALDTELEALWANATLTRSQLDVLAVVCFQWLEQRRPVEGVTLLQSDMSDVEWLLRSVKTALKIASEATHLRKQIIEEKTGMIEEIDYLNMERDQLKWANAELNGKVMAMEQSSSWRLTKPLRRLRGLMC